MLKRLMRCVSEVHCTFCRYETSGSPLELPRGWMLFDNGALMCDECQEETMTGKRASTRLC